MKIVALDPGGTTGWCEQFYDHDFYREQLGPEDHHKALWMKLVSAQPFDALVVERFRYIPGQEHAVLISCEYIGVARLFCDWTGTPLVMQSPNQAKEFWTDDKLKKLGLWLPDSPHAMDAARHLLYYVTVTLKDNRYVLRLRP